MLSDQLFDGGNAQVEVELLRYAISRPRRGSHLADLLEGKPGFPCRVEKHEPIAPSRVRLVCGWGLVTGPVVVPQELAVELGESAGISRVEDN